MRFNNYLTEKKVNIDDIVDILRKDCSQFIKENKSMILYRGSNKNINDILLIKPRTNRRPVDMPSDLHDTLDDLFYDKFGCKYRSEGVFTTGDNVRADFYGEAYLFFPFDGYKFIWSPAIGDLFGEYERFSGDTYDAYEFIKNSVKKYTDKNLSKAILSGNEIMFKCKKYYLVNTGHEYNLYRILKGK